MFNFRNTNVLKYFSVLLLPFLILGLNFVFADTSDVTVEVVFTDCSDGIDNDSDGLTDFPNDPGCSSSADDDETDSTPPSSGGGGGGGSSGGVYLTSVSFSGMAYPDSTVGLLKDGQLAVSVQAGPDGKFKLSLTNLVSGNYTFSVFAEDSDGRRSTGITNSIFITSGATTNVSGIFLAPTIAIDKEQVKRGDNLVVFGYAASSGQVVIEFNSEEPVFAYTDAEEDGSYLHRFDTSVLEDGEHSVKSKAGLVNDVSPYGEALLFLVGDQSVEGTPFRLIGDLNFDGKVNLIDLSILSFWYKKEGFPPHVDLSNDSFINLVDFSIMVYHWTG